MPTASAAAILRHLAGATPALAKLPLLLVVAHPDDEAIGLGGRLPLLRLAHVAYVTDGAPRDMRDAIRLGFATREEYAQARRREADAAMALLGVEPHRIHRLDLVDQETPLHLKALTEACGRLIDELAPVAVITHAYEGGHPDHDAAALAVHLACRLREQSGRQAPVILEFAGYHDPDGSGRMATLRFLPAAVPTVAVRLKAAEQDRKRRALDCYATQAELLRLFRNDREQFRAAPRYRFAASPHPWHPFYERFVADMDGLRWRQLASRTLARYGVAGPI